MFHNFTYYPLPKLFNELMVFVQNSIAFSQHSTGLVSIFE